MKTILLTGATGFLGSNLAHRLVADGYKVLAFKRPSSKLDRLAPILSHVFLYDISEENLARPFKEHEKIDAVIHTATCYGKNGESLAEIFDANIAFPLRLLETACLFNTDIFINTDTFFSSNKINYAYLDSYALSKKHFSEWGKIYAKRNFINFLNVRLEHMYGAGDAPAKFVSQIVHECMANVNEISLTLGEQKRDFVYIDDVTAAYIILIEKVPPKVESFQEYEIGSGKAIPIREFVETVHKLTNSSTKLHFGALPYRTNEIMNSEANVTQLNSLGWKHRISLSDGVKNIIRFENDLKKTTSNID